jgi:hypothetical protein
MYNTVISPPLTPLKQVFVIFRSILIKIVLGVITICMLPFKNVERIEKNTLKRLHFICSCLDVLYICKLPNK